MKRIKILILLLFIILLSGCSVEYDLTINSDSTVTEKVVAKETTNRMKSRTGLSEKESVSYLYKMFKRDGLNTIISTKTEDPYTISTVTGTHSSVKQYAKNFKSDVFKNVEYSEKDNIVTLKLNQDKVLSSSASKGLVYDEITINMYVPFVVKDHNAESHQRNKYTWHINKDEKLKELTISYDKTSLTHAKTFHFGKIKFSVRYELLVIGSIILIVGLIVLFVYHNNKKNNRV